MVSLTLFNSNKIFEKLNSTVENYIYTLKTTNINFNPTIFSLYHNIFDLTIMLVIGLGLFFFINTYGIKFISNPNSNQDNYATIYSYLNNLEEEIGAIDDIIVYSLVFVLVITWFFFLTLIGSYIFKTLTWIFMLINIVALTAIFIPVFVLKNFGVAFVSYVRGSGRTSSLLFEGLLDFISTLIIMLRFVIQNIRFVFIFAAFFELYEFIYDKIFLDFQYMYATKIRNFQFDTLYCGWYWYEIVGHIIITWGLYLYYLGHLTLLFIAQLITYFALSFWLFFFLYTTFILETHEKYFLFKRLVK